MKLNRIEECVREFHEKFGADIGDQNLPRFQNAQLRKNLLTEEYQEFLHAIDWGNFDEAVHEAIDILYVTVGALVAWGIKDIDAYVEEVHAANMRKAGGKTREDGKIMKPEGWKPADIGMMIRMQPTRLAKKEQKTEDVPVIDFDNTPIVYEIIRPEETSLNVEVSTEETKKTGGKRGRPSRNN